MPRFHWLAALCAVTSAACALPHAELRGDASAPIDAMIEPDGAPDVPTPPPDSGCASGQQLCGGSCVDTQRDANHCGACNNACGANANCVNGSCQSTCTSPNRVCGTACVDTQSDVNHCGACSAMCPSGQRCNSGMCRPDCGTMTDCSGSCVDTRTSAQHCGACGRACGANQGCVGGACACANDAETLCSGACVNTRTDTNHCGACGVRCNSMQSCVSGVCTCPANTRTCAGVDGCLPNNSPMYCGASCTTCPAITNGTPACVMGMCTGTCGPGFALMGNACVSTTCGNRMLDAGETCDDGNTTPGDGCSATCQLEANTSTTGCSGMRTPLRISLGQTIRLRGATSGMTNNFDSCNMARARGPELVFEVQVDQTGYLRTTVTPTGSNWDIVLRGGDTCPGACIDRYYGGTAEAAKTDSPIMAGTRFFLIVDGVGNGENGSFTLETELRSTPFP